MENSIPDRSSESPKVVSIKPKEDGFYQLGYREAVSDILYYTMLAVALKLLWDQFHQSE